MVTQLWLQTIRPAFMGWTVFWILVFTVDNSSTEFAALQMFFALLMGMMVGHVINEIRHSPYSWHLPNHQRVFLWFFLFHSLLWTSVSSFLVDTELTEKYGYASVFLLIYLWFTVGSSIRKSPSLMVPSTYFIWLGYVILVMWPDFTLGLASQYPVLAILIWLIAVPSFIFANLSHKTHRKLLNEPFMSFFGSIDENRMRTFREELITKWSANSSMWQRSLADSNFRTWIGAIYYENLGFLSLRYLVFNFISIIGFIVIFTSTISLPEFNPEHIAYFALFWLCMILATEYPVRLSPNLIYPLSRRSRGLLSLCMRLLQILVSVTIFIAVVSMSQLLPAFEIETEAGVTLRWLQMERPMAGVLLTLGLMSLYYILMLFVTHCKYAFVTMMAISGFLFGLLMGPRNRGGFNPLYDNHVLTIFALCMVALWAVLHMRHYRVRDIPY